MKKTFFGILLATVMCFSSTLASVSADNTGVIGDIDGSGKLDIDDAVLLFRHSMLPTSYPITYSGIIDFNGDGKLNIDDAVLLFRHSMLPDKYPLVGLDYDDKEGWSNIYKP